MREFKRAEEIMRAGPVLAHHVHPHGGFNRWLAIHVSSAVGSMWCAYLFALIAIVGFPGLTVGGAHLVDLSPATPQQYVQWTAQTFLQLVLLSVILVGQAVQQAHADARSEQDHALHVAAHAKLDALRAGLIPPDTTAGNSPPAAG